jgi:alkylation response protein AidB-like acyl-CoA dehydrogenase
MNLPGIEVKPLYAFNGKRLWNQVFFTNVRVPKENRLGPENQGWTVAKNILGDERLMVSRVAENKRILSRLKALLVEQQSSFHPDQSFLSRLAGIEIRLTSLEVMALRLLGHFDSGGSVGAEPSMLKLQGSQLVQAQDQLLFEIAGAYGLPLDAITRGQAEPVFSEDVDMIASAMFHHRGYTIAGGASEIQRNIIAQQVLKL